MRIEVKRLALQINGLVTVQYKLLLKFCTDYSKINKQEIYNHFHNILRLFDVLPNFPFTTSEAMGDYYL